VNGYGNTKLYSFFFISSLVFLLSEIENCYSYYSPGDKQVSPIIHNDNPSVSWLKGEKFFVVYDNAKHERGESYQASLLFPRSTYFVPADLIRCNLTIYDSLYQPKTVEHSLRNILFAKLRERQLLKKREEIHRKAHKIIADVNSQSILEDDFLSLIENINQNTSNDQYERAGFNDTVSIASQWEKVHREIISVDLQRNTSYSQIAGMQKEKGRMLAQGTSLSQYARAEQLALNAYKFEAISYTEGSKMPSILQVSYKTWQFMMKKKGVILTSIIFFTGVISLISYLRNSPGRKV
jgi:hypothetical protein